MSHRVRNPEKAKVPLFRKTTRDVTIGWLALGLLSHLLGRPSNWKVRGDVLAAERPSMAGCTEGQVMKALAELRAAGYYRLERRRMLDGTFKMGTAVSPEPVPEWVTDNEEFSGKAVPLIEQSDGTFRVRHKDGTLTSDGFEDVEGEEDYYGPNEPDDDYYDPDETDESQLGDFPEPGDAGPENPTKEKARSSQLQGFPDPDQPGPGQPGPAQPGPAQVGANRTTTTTEEKRDEKKGGSESFADAQDSAESAGAATAGQQAFDGMPEPAKGKPPAAEQTKSAAAQAGLPELPPLAAPPQTRDEALPYAKRLATWWLNELKKRNIRVMDRSRNAKGSSVSRPYWALADGLFVPALRAGFTERQIADAMPQAFKTTGNAAPTWAVFERCLHAVHGTHTPGNQAGRTSNLHLDSEGAAQDLQRRFEEAL